MPDFAVDDPAFDPLDIAWHQLSKRALRRTTRGGRAVRIILPASQRLEHGAVLSQSESQQIIVNVPPSQTLVIQPASATELSRIAYAIGNLHIPAQIHEARIIVPADLSTEAALGRLGIAYQLQLLRFAPIPNVLPQLSIAEELRK
jgi:urease accessory protein